MASQNKPQLPPKPPLAPKPSSIPPRSSSSAPSTLPDPAASFAANSARAESTSPSQSPAPQAPVSPAPVPTRSSKPPITPKPSSITSQNPSLQPQNIEPASVFDSQQDIEPVNTTKTTDPVTAPMVTSAKVDQDDSEVDATQASPSPREPISGEIEEDDEEANSLPQPPPTPPLLDAPEAPPLPTPGQGISALMEAINARRLRMAEEIQIQPAVRVHVPITSELHRRVAQHRQKNISMIEEEILPEIQNKIKFLRIQILNLTFPNFESVVYIYDEIQEEIRKLSSIDSGDVDALLTHWAWPFDLYHSFLVCVPPIKDLLHLRDQLTNFTVPDDVTKIKTKEIEALLSRLLSVLATLNSDTCQMAISTLDLSRRLVVLIESVKELAVPLLEMLVTKANSVMETLRIVHENSFNKSSRAVLCYSLLTFFLQAVKDLSIISHVRQIIPEVQAKLQQLEQNHSQAINVHFRRGQWDRPGLITPKEDKQERTIVHEISEAIKQNASQEELRKMLIQAKENQVRFSENQMIWFRACMTTNNIQALECLLDENFQTIHDNLMFRDFNLLFEIVTKNLKNFIQPISRLGVNLNVQSPESGMTCLHIAARRSDVSMMGFLIENGVNPLIENQLSKTALEVIAIKDFVVAHTPTITTTAQASILSFSSYINNEQHSDIIFKLDDGTQFYAHKIILCAQSDYFRRMFEGNRWTTSDHIVIQGFNKTCVRIFLEFLYTGVCLFPRDELQLGCDLLAMSHIYLLPIMQHQCEHLISEKLNVDNVFTLFDAAITFSAPLLLRSVCYFIFTNYKKITDPKHEKLIEILNTIKIDDVQQRDVKDASDRRS